jgi:hypothetical protein
MKKEKSTSSLLFPQKEVGKCLSTCVYSEDFDRIGNNCFLSS